MRRLSLVLAVASALLAGCLFGPYPEYATTVTTPPSFDRSWDAALGAADDAGIQVTGADRSTGQITGTKAGAAVTIELRPLPDNRLQVTFSSPDSKESNPTLGDRWQKAYHRRMGR